MPNNEEEFLEENEELEETPEIQEQNEPVQEEPASIGSTIKDDVKATAKAEISKKALSFLMKNPYFWGIIAIIIVIIVIIVLIYGIDFDFVGKGDTNPKVYSTSCDKIYLTWENEEYIEDQKEAGTYTEATNPQNVDLSDTDRYSYESYNYDEYVTGIVWNDNRNAGDLNNDIVYSAMAIAARSRVVSSLGNNCVVLKNHNPENFIELSGNEDKYSEISTAVSNTSGLIIGRDGTPIYALYDAFTYVSKYKEVNADYDSKGSYYMMNKNETGQQVIPASWVSENVKVIKQKALNWKYLESMSLYGAKYLLEKTDSQYDLYRVLKYYYGADIEYYTIGTGNTNYKCSQIDFAKTSLTREEFIGLVTSYLSGKTTTTAKTFINNAGNIYDWGLEVGANPEMIYIMAEKEQGWSKDSDFAIRCNNFYGMGVYNGENDGMCFDTFEEGVKYELEYIKEKGTLDALTKVYSYLGTYLANPGSWGDGGCIYLTLPEIYGPDYSRCDPSYKCASSNGGPGCVETTEAEKQAYIDWQASKILDIRKRIFLLDADACGYEGSTDGTTFLNESISTFLSNNGTTLDEFNNKVLAVGCRYQGTGTGVAGVAATAVSELAAYGKKFHYQWGGMHTAAAPSSYGIPSNWGPSGTGPDCSGFVSWALYNAGFNWRSLGATDWAKTGEVVNLGDERIQVGDFIVTPGNRGYNHIVIITAINNDNYHVVEAASTNTGVVFNQISMNDSKRKAVLMSDYYATAAKSSTFSSMCTTKGLS